MRKSSVVTVLAVLAAALVVAWPSSGPLAVAPSGSGAGSGEVDVKVLVTPPAAPLAPGARGETTLLLSPPSGIKINRYPQVKLTLQAPAAIRLDAAEMKQGSPTPIEDPEEFPFKVIEPMKIGFSVAPDAPAGTAKVTGKINFVYCISRSGYCQRTTREVGFDVTVAPARAN